MPVTRKHLVILTVSAAAIGAGGLIVQAPWNVRQMARTGRTAQTASSPSAVRSVPRQSVRPEPEFPKGGPAPEGTVTLADVHLQTVVNPLLFSSPNRLTARAADGKIIIAEPKTNRMIWRGLPADAQFVHECTAGVDTLKDRSGHVLWSNAAEFGSPDLVLQTTRENKRTLRGKDGRVLWTGILSSPLQNHASTPRENRPIRKGAFLVDNGGIVLEGTKTAFTITDHGQRRIWSGSLQKYPSLLIRNGPSFNWSGANHAMSGSDSVSEVQLSLNSGAVTIENTQGKQLGTHPLMFLNSDSRIVRSAMPGIPTGPQVINFRRVLTPNATLSTKGTALPTYRDSTGTIVRRSRIFRSKDSVGYSG